MKSWPHAERDALPALALKDEITQKRVYHPYTYSVLFCFSFVGTVYYRRWIASNRTSIYHTVHGLLFCASFAP